ncbi:MAG: cAMP-binding protein [Candidatus Puniceispirillum sp.]|nr:cAMP-binding protein [Candidatus Pelagibacter sp.]MBA4283084.1 cAMP-binding protein [Candidatus Puniceispirillum sp.]
MIDGVQERKFQEAGKIIFKKGDNGFACFFIDSGSVELWDHVNGTDQLKFTIHKGGIFGEMALIDSGPRSLTAKTGKEGATLITIKSDYVQKILKESHPFLKILVSRLIENLRSRP